MLCKVTFTASVEIDVWVKSDDEAHAQSLVEANNPETYDRVRSTLSFGTGAIRLEDKSINVTHVEVVQ